MKAVVCTRYGPPEVLRLEERATPVPRENEVRIRVLATAVMPSDGYVRGLNLSLAYRLMARLALGWSAPRQPVLGMVLSGEVDSVGPDARSFEVGERVFGFNRRRFGTYAQYGKSNGPDEGARRQVIRALRADGRDHGDR